MYEFAIIARIRRAGVPYGKVAIEPIHKRDGAILTAEELPTTPMNHCLEHGRVIFYAGESCPACEDLKKISSDR